MIRFTLFGIPVSIQPFFWLTSALLGGALSANSPEQILKVTLFMLVVLASILIHEFGHALTGRRLGGGYASVEVGAFGGLASNYGGRFSQSGHFWRILAGPLAGFGFLFATILLVAICHNLSDALSLAGLSLFGSAFNSFSDGSSLVAYLSEHPYAFILIAYILQINFWWGIINLLPILPLDGGQLVALFSKNPKTVFVLGFIFASLATIFFISVQSIYSSLLFGYLAWQQYNHMRNA